MGACARPSAEDAAIEGWRLGVAEGAWEREGGVEAPAGVAAEAAMVEEEEEVEARSAAAQQSTKAHIRSRHLFECVHTLWTGRGSEERGHGTKSRRGEREREDA